MLGGERATEECRIDKRGNVQEEARQNKGRPVRAKRRREIEKGWYSEGSSVRIIFTEEEEDDDEEEKEEVEEETLPLFVVAGETKNGG